MNGFGGMPGPYYNTAGPSPISTPAIPQTALPDMSYLPDTPTQLPLTGQPGLPYLPDTPTQLPLTGQPGLPYVPDVGLPAVSQPTLPELTLPDDTPPGGFGPYLEELTKTTGPLEVVGEIVDFAGDVIQTAADVAWDTGKFILEHLEVGITWAGDISGTAAKKKYYEQLGEAQKTAAEAAETRAKAYAQLVARGEMSQEEAIARGMAYGMESQKGLTAGQPVIYETPAAKQLSDYMPLAIAGIAAVLLLKKGKI